MVTFTPHAAANGLDICRDPRFGFEPLHCQFGPDGALYVVDWGEIRLAPEVGGIRVAKGTGSLWRIRRTGATRGEEPPRPPLVPAYRIRLLGLGAAGAGALAAAASLDVRYRAHPGGGHVRHVTCRFSCPDEAAVNSGFVAGLSVADRQSGLPQVKGAATVITHKVGTREEWLQARRALLEREKELTRLSDELARQRRELPWVPVDKPYSFDTNEGSKTLAELFDGRSQLLIYHFMFAPEWDAGCPSCSASADSFDGGLVHLEQRDVTMLCVSRAPLEKLNAYKRRMGWRFPWVSSLGSDFNFDFGVSFTEEQRANGAEYNFRKQYELLEELPGLSAFALDGIVYHTYSSYARGTDILRGDYQLLDRAPKGRDEDDLPWTMAWLRRHDEYGNEPTGDLA